MSSDNHPNLDWIEHISPDEFRGIVDRYPPRALKKLRDDLVAKYRAMTEQRLEPMCVKSNRDGSPMSEYQYQDWSDRIAKATKLTEQQLAYVNSRICEAGLIGNLPIRKVVQSLYTMAVPQTEEDDNLMAIVSNYLRGDRNV